MKMRRGLDFYQGFLTVKYFVNSSQVSPVKIRLFGDTD